MQRKEQKKQWAGIGGKMVVKITKKIINFETLLPAKVSKRPLADKAVCIKQECLF